MHHKRQFGCWQTRQRQNVSMTRKRVQFLTFLGIYFVGLVLFFIGFFLTRRELYKRSSRESSISLEDLNFFRKVFSNDGEKDGREAHRVILLIIDGLRLDFLLSHDTSREAVRPVYNQFTVVSDLLESNPSHSLLYGFRADPPTVTAQRLKSLTTGSLPTFIDIGSNLNSSAVTEDNLLDQFAYYHGQTDELVVLGDDTWHALYPTQFTTYHVFDSFNTHDLYTVDNGIQAHLYEELEKKDWKLLVAHFLGVDHIGHTHNAFHPYMKIHLALLNNVIKRVIENMDKDAVLVVCGDHGITDEGEHGGGSQEEVDSALFLYSPSLTFSPPAHFTTISQLDLLPMLCYWLDLPVPFSSLGIVREEIFSSPLILTREYSRNLFQLWRYICAYFFADIYAGCKLEDILPLLLEEEKRVKENELSKKKGFGGNEVMRQIMKSEWSEVFLDAVEVSFLHSNYLLSDRTAKTEELNALQERYKLTLEEIQMKMRVKYTQYHYPSILIGLLSMMIAVYLLFPVEYMKSSNILMGGIVCFHILAPFSNSFVIEDHRISWTILQCILCYFLPSSSLSTIVEKGISLTSFLSSSSLLSLFPLFLNRFLLSLSHTAPLSSVYLVPLICVSSLSFLSIPNKLTPRISDSSSNIWISTISKFILLYLKSYSQHSKNFNIVYLSIVVIQVISIFIAVLSFSARRLESMQCKSIVLIHIYVLIITYTLSLQDILIIDVYILLLLHVTNFVQDEPSVALTFVFTSRSIFYLTNHHTQFNKLHLGVAFLGLEHFHFYYAGAALFVNTFASDIITLLLAGVYRPPICFKVVYYRLLMALTSSIAVLVLSRHLMLPAVFAPKVVFESAGAAVNVMIYLLIQI